MPIINRPPVGSDNNDKHYEALVKRQMKNDKSHDASRKYAAIPVGSTVVVQHKYWWNVDPWNNRRKG